VHPDCGADLIGALDALMTLTPQTLERWPGLTEAVHWLVDDTWWDERDMAESIRFTAYLRHERWSDVRSAAASAHRLLIVRNCQG
jgi:hypothetical protein